MIKRLTNMFMKTSPRDFTYTCIFEYQIPHHYTWDGKYLVEMESGRIALFSVSESGYYWGTGQRDYSFKFIIYVGNNEIKVVDLPSLDPSKNFKKKGYRIRGGT